MVRDRLGQPERIILANPGSLSSRRPAHAGVKERYPHDLESPMTPFKISSLVLVIISSMFVPVRKSRVQNTRF